MTTIRHTLETLAASVCKSGRDWSQNPHDARIYEILIGWGDALPEVARRHGWTSEDLRTLGAMSAAVIRAEAA